MSYEETTDVMKGKSLDELLFDGLYPAVCAKKNIARFIYPSYVKTYLERDVRDILKVKYIMQFNTYKTDKLQEYQYHTRLT